MKNPANSREKKKLRKCCVFRESHSRRGGESALMAPAGEQELPVEFH
jgi:hypothetical protein